MEVDDQEGFALLERWVAEHQATLYRAACLILHDPAAAEEVAQEAFVRAHRAGAKVEDDDARRWLRRVAVNLALNRLRSRTREERALSRVGVSGDMGDDPADAVVGRLDTNAALARLPERLRIPVILRYYVDLSERDIASALEVRVGTVKSRLHEAKRLLAEDLSIALVEEVG
jgi:RNA polymerase sigma factor (sigma-70 family)